MNRDPASGSSPLKPNCALALMAKVPSPGAVKTRLTPPLTPEDAAKLSMCFLRDMTTNLSSVGRDRVEAMVLYTPTNAEALLHDLLPDSFRLVPQRGATLGERLANAATELLNDGFESVCLINADSPTLPREILTTAVSILAQDGDRLVLGPSQDGGYYLIGLKRPHRCLFEGIPWSTSDVLAHTIERAANMDLRVELLPLWYDVDDAATLRLLCEELSLLSDGHHSRVQFHSGFHAAHTRAYLAELIAKEGHEQFIAATTIAKTRA